MRYNAYDVLAQIRRPVRLLFVLLFVAAAAACSGGGSSSLPAVQAGAARNALNTAGGGTAVTLAIDAGGPATAGFTADQYFTASSSTGTDTSPIDVSGPNVAPAAIFATFRTAPGTLTYAITGLVPNSAAHGFLFFEEPQLSGSGGRVLDVTAGGTTVAAALDIFATAGAAHKAVGVPFSAIADATGTLQIAIVPLNGSAIISGLKVYATAAPAPSPSPSVPPQAAVLSINAGGAAASTFSADAYFGAASSAGTDGIPVNVSGPNLAPAVIFATYRMAPGTLTYAIPGYAPSSAAHGFLFFEEPLLTGAGQRVMNVSIGSTTVATAFDIFAAAGAAHTGVSLSFNATTDATGTLQIVLTPVAGSPIVSGFKVYGTPAPAPVATPTPTPTATPTPLPTPSPTPTPVVVRRGFLGAFYRAEGAPPYGVFASGSPNQKPNPYPSPGTTLFGPSGYCDAVAPNGYSISSGYVVDPAKLSDIVNLGVKWTRTEISADLIDQSHIFGTYTFDTLDSAQCAALRNGITPIVGIEAGQVNYDAVPGVYSPVVEPNYESAPDFGQYCGVIAAHETQTFGAVTRYSIPGNEINDNPAAFGGGEAQIAAYTQACYHAIKTIQPNAVVYGFELDMNSTRNAPAFVQRMTGRGCGVGTCYDALSIHLFPPYPLPPAGTPCYPNPGGNYDLQCVTDVRDGRPRSGAARADR